MIRSAGCGQRCGHSSSFRFPFCFIQLLDARLLLSHLTSLFHVSGDLLHRLVDHLLVLDGVDQLCLTPLFHLLLERLTGVQKAALLCLKLFFDLGQFCFQFLLVICQRLHLALQNLHAVRHDDGPDIRDDRVAENLIDQAMIAQVPGGCDVLLRKLVHVLIVIDRLQRDFAIGQLLRRLEALPVKRGER